jgi:hypothetical protein
VARRAPPAPLPLPTPPGARDFHGKAALAGFRGSEPVDQDRLLSLMRVWLSR